MTPPPFWNFSENSSVLEGEGVPYSDNGYDYDDDYDNDDDGDVLMMIMVWLLERGCKHLTPWIYYEIPNPIDL